MTREECENKIFEKLLEIQAIVEEYNPGFGYLSMCINTTSDGIERHISANNEWWSNDVDHPINSSLFINKGHRHFTEKDQDDAEVSE